MNPVGPYDEEMYDGPEISGRVRETAREFFSPKAEDAEDQRQEPEPASKCESTAGLDARPGHADGRGSAVSDGVLISNDELHALLGRAWMSGYTQGGGGQGGSIPHPSPTSLVRQNTRISLGSGVSVSDLPPNPDTPDMNWYPVLHVNGKYPCSSVAFYVTSRPRRDMIAKLELMRIFASPKVPPGTPIPEPYWRAPLPNDEPHCATCDLRIDPYSTEDVDWNAVLF